MPQHRRVVTNTAPLKVVSPPPVQKKLDPALAPGTSEVEDPGEDALSTSVERLVYGSDGKLLSDNTWYSNYRSSPEILLVGPTPKAPPKPKTKTATAPATTTTRRLRYPRRQLETSNSLPQPLRGPGRAERHRVDRTMGGPAVRDHGSVALDRVLEPEARAAHVEAAGVDERRSSDSLASISTIITIISSYCSSYRCISIKNRTSSCSNSYSISLWSNCKCCIINKLTSSSTSTTSI